MPDALPLPDPPLTDGVVSLRAWAPEDHAGLLAASDDQLVRRYRYSLPDDPGQARAWLAAVWRDRLSGERLELAMIAGDDPAPVGSIALWGFHCRNHSAMTSYWLGHAGRGRGLATGALRLLAAWAFEELGQQRLSLHVEVDNIASQRLAERCGFVCEGRLRSHQ